MDILFIADPLAHFKIHKETTYAMMRTAQAAGARVWHGQARQVFAQDGIFTTAQRIALLADEERGDGAWWRVEEEAVLPLTHWDAVILRKDPPFDVTYVTDTWLLDAAEREGARLFNRPLAIRNHSEKVSVLEFAAFAAPTLISSERSRIEAFHQQHGEIILKPLDGMGGAGIFKINADAMNLGSAVELLTEHGQRAIMAQRYLPAISAGDKRILLIGGEVVPYALARIPQGNDIRGNMAAGGKAVAQELTARDREIAETLAPILHARGVFLTGLDVIGEHVTEINVTSPTGFQEISQQTGFDVAAMWWQRLCAELTTR